MRLQLIALLGSGALALALPAANAMPAGPPTNGEQPSKPSKTQEDTVELEGMTVEGIPFDINRPKLMRMVKAGLNAHRSSDPEDLDTLVCRKETTIGSHIPVVRCATNRTWLYMRGESLSSFQRMQRELATSDSGGTGPSGMGKLGLTGSRIQTNHPAARRGLVFRVRGAALREIKSMPDEQGTKAMVAPPGGIMPPHSDMERFAAAYTEVKRIRERYDRRMAQAGADSERRELQREADRSMTKAIEEAGLDVERYNEIADKIAKHEVVKAAVAELLAHEE